MDISHQIQLGFYLNMSKSTHPPTNKKPRLESIKLQSGYETDLNIKK